MPKSLRTTDLREHSQGERFILFFFVVAPGNHSASCVANYARMVTHRVGISVEVVRELMNGLLQQEVLEEGAAAQGVHERVYRLTAHLTGRALRTLCEDAVRQGWWPTPVLASDGLVGAWLGAELPFAVRNYVAPMQVWQVAETFRGIVLGGDCGAFGLPPRATYSLASVHWAMVEHLLSVLGDNAFDPAEGLSPRAVESLLPVLFESAFLHVADVRPALAAGCRLFKVAGVHPASATLCAYCALCVWCGRRDLLNGVASIVPPGSPAESFAALCMDVFEGRFDAAEKAFAARADGFRGTRPEEVSTPVWLLGMALALRTGAPVARVARAARELKAEPTDTLQWHPVGRGAVRAALSRRGELVDEVMSACSAEWRPRGPRTAEGEDALQPARRAFCAGYPTLASLLAEAAGRADPRLPHLDELRELFAKEGSVALVKSLPREPEWKAVLRALGDCLPARGASEKGEATLNGSIGWSLAFTVWPGTGDWACRCERLVPFYRGPRGRADGSDDRPLTLKGLSAAKYRACLTSCDAEVLQALLTHGYNPRVAYSVPEEAIGLLCGHPRLMVGPSGSTLKDDVPRVPMTLERRRCEMTTAKEPNGGMRLSLPDWMWTSPNGTFGLLRVADDAYAYYPMPKKVRDLAEVFRAQGGAFALPPEALPEARDVLARAAGVMSVAGAFAVEGEGAFRRVAGDATPCVRLVYANEELSLALVVNPLPNHAVAACEPGVGLAERLVQLRGGRTVLLARDLAAEEQAAAPVRAALAPFDAWATSRSRWLVKSAESALDALRTVRDLAGVRLEWPEGEKVRLAAPAAKGVRIQASGEDWFQLDGEVKLDDGRVLSLMALLRALADREGGYVRFGENDYLYLSRELLQRMDALALAGGVAEGDAEGRVSAAALPMLARAFEEEDEDLPSLPETMAARAAAVRAAFAEVVEVPRRFKGVLRPYQVDGYAWLSHLAACGFGACLADDMGLGKTVQVIALLLARAEEGPSLVVAPASVCVNWVRELERFAPTLHPLTLWDTASTPTAAGAGDVVVSSYGLLVSRADDFAAVAWNGVVLDEAQAVKNAATQRAQVARRLKARFRVAATGTPVENRLLEFWSIFSFLNPGLLGSARAFEERFVEANFATAGLKRLVEPFVLRRLKREVLKELPEKTELTLRVELGAEERAAYEACRRDALEGLSDPAVAGNRISILAALTRLRRYCCHPSLVFPEATRSAKLDAVLELLGDLREAGHRALVFSQFVDYLQIVRDAIADRKWSFRYLDGSTSAADRAAAVDAFQRGDGDFFLISLKAGGTGLNLTAANYVLLLDPWWNPAVEDQAADRAHRIGQKLPVTVYRVVAANTVEERILDLHGDKRAVSEDLLESANGVPLTTERLMSLFV